MVMSESIRALFACADPESAATERSQLEQARDTLRVDTVTSVSEALETLEDGDVDCIVSEAELSQHDGLAFVERVREQSPEMPVILFTAKRTAVGAALDAGVSDVVQKDASPDEYALLANAISNAVERVRAQRAATQQRSRTETLLAAPADYVLVTDTEGTIEYVSPAVESVLGYEPAQLTGSTAFEWLHPDDRGRAIDNFLSHVDEPGASWTVETRVQNTDGAWHWLEIRCRNCRDDPEIGGIVGHVRDITEQKETSTAVDWHRQIIENMGEGVYVLDENARFRFVAYRTDDIDGFDAQEWEGESVTHLAETGVLSETEVATVEAAIDSLLDGEAGEIRVDLSPTVPESVETVELRLVALDLPGESPCVLGTTRDVTGRRERERQLRETTERYQTLIENFPNGGVFVFDENLEYLLAGGTELAEVGLTSEAVEGQQPSDLFPPDIAAEIEEYYRATLAGEQTSFEQSFQGGHYRIHTLPLEDEDGAISSGMAVSQNVTERTERRQELERQNERLDEFASVVSHDLRNPLSVLATSLELAEETGEDAHFDRCYRSLDRMEELLDDLLTLARQGEEITDRSAVDIELAARQCWDTVNSPKTSLDVETSMTLSADEGRLRQLFENLFRNSVEHGSTNGQSESVTITVGELEDGFYVADDGVGIPSSEHDEVFESGYSTSANGTGFGLAIVDEIATAHGWDVDVTDSESGGARFEITDVDPKT
jgi:PAS domain S-box-containing protein